MRIHYNRRFSLKKYSSLSKELAGSIKLSGALSLGNYMKSCLLHPRSGYYMKRDVFGASGDFITSPEISQVFGELVAIWFIYNFQLQHTPMKKKISLVELGPGRGTLMADILRTIGQFPSFQAQIASVTFVEASEYLKTVQYDNMKGLIAPEKLQWHSRLQDVPSNPDEYTFFLAHEFFDALPIFQFKKLKGGWREILVDLHDVDNEDVQFRQVLAKDPTKSLLLLQSEQQKKIYADAKEGDIIQICPEGWDISCEIGKRISNHGGSGLIIDYGSLHIRDSRLRGIQNHKWVSPFSSPGFVDLSSDVEFSPLKIAAETAGNCHSFGPISQHAFLFNMGIDQRLRDLMKASKSAKQSKELIRAVDRLVGPEEMGNVYKFLALSNSKYLHCF